MSNEEVKQRIQYLVEHGGLYDDPLADLRHYARTTRYALAALAVLVGIDLSLHLL